MLSIFSCVYWPSVYLIWSNVWLGILPIFLIRLFLFWFWVAWAVCTFWRLMPCQLLCLQIFSPILRVVYDTEIPLLAIYPEKIIMQEDMCIPVFIAALFTIARTWTWASLVAQVGLSLQCERPGFSSWVRKMPWRGAWQSTPVFLPGESPWTKEPGRLQSMGSQRIRHDWVAKYSAGHGSNLNVHQQMIG